MCENHGQVYRKKIPGPISASILLKLEVTIDNLTLPSVIWGRLKVSTPTFMLRLSVFLTGYLYMRIEDTGYDATYYLCQEAI